MEGYTKEKQRKGRDKNENVVILGNFRRASNMYVVLKSDIFNKICNNIVGEIANKSGHD